MTCFARLRPFEIIDLIYAIFEAEGAVEELAAAGAAVVAAGAV